MILDVLRFFDGRRDDVRFAYVHKPFATMCKVVDWIVEPDARKRGGDLNERGRNLSLANLLYHATADLASREYRQRLLAAFMDLMANPGPKTFTVFGDVIVEKCRPTPENPAGPLKDLLDILYDALIEMTPRETMTWGPQNLDVTIAIALSLMHGWKQSRGNTILIHDASSNMAKQKDVWDALVSPNVQEAVVGWDRRRMVYPIQVHKTQFVNSRDSAGIQLADILAGAIAECLKIMDGGTEPVDAYQKELAEIVGPWECVEHIWPERKYTPADLGTDGPVFADPNRFVNAILQGVEESGNDA